MTTWEDVEPKPVAPVKTLKELVDAYQQSVITKRFLDNKGNITKTALSLKANRNKIGELVKKYGLTNDVGRTLLFKKMMRDHLS